MWFGLLGPLCVRSDDGMLRVTAARQRVVLAALAIRAGQVVSFEDLARSIWDGQPPVNARVAVRNHVCRLRRLLGPAGDRIVTRPPGYLLDASDDEVDLLTFGRLCRDGGVALRAGDWQQASDVLGEALDCWRGVPLPDIPSRVIRDEQIPALESLRLQATEWRIEAGLNLGRHSQFVSELQAMAREQPLRERFAEMLMLALYRCGRQAEALAAYQSTRQTLVDELGVEPGPDLQELHCRILAADPALIQPPRLADPRRPEMNGHDGTPLDLPGPRPAVPDPPEPRPAVPYPPGPHPAVPYLPEPRPAVPYLPEPRPTAAPALPAPHQLPARVRHFAGRRRELAALDALLTEAGERGAMVIAVIHGTAGAGKTALAVHWAHQAADRFPDGHLYADLRGFGPSGTPVTATETVGDFLHALGAPAGQVPPGQAAQAAMYRTLTAGKRLLIVLDNVRGVDQVLPLLPGSPGCLVLVTSRAKLAGLAAAGGAQLLPLGLPSPDEASDLLAGRLGAGSLAAEPDAAGELIGLCARLPLALSIAAARAAARPWLPLAALAAELRQAASRLDALDAGTAASSARVVFSWSCQGLTTSAARMFRLLGVHPGPDISVPAAASLTGQPPRQAQTALRELDQASLVTEHAPGRYSLHDLLRAYAADQARDRESEPDRKAATGRILDHYLHTAAHAAVLLCPNSWKASLAPLRAGTEPEQLASYQQAMTWFEAEHRILLAAVATAAESGFDSHAWQLPWTMEPFLRTRGRYQELADTQRMALAAATRLGDTAAQALSGHFLAGACCGLGDYDRAADCYMTGLSLYQQLGNRLGEAQIHAGLSFLAASQGRNADALHSARQALRLYRAIGHKQGEADVLNSVGWYHALLGDYEQARVYCRQALTLSADANDRRVAGYTWDSLGYIEHHLGNLGEAAACYDRALSIVREFGVRYAEAVVLTHLGDTRSAERDLPRACEAWLQALVIFEELQHPDAGPVRTKLGSQKAYRFKAQLL